MANPSPSLKSHCHELGGSANGMLEVDALVTTDDYQYIDPKLLSETTSQVLDAGKHQQCVVNATQPQTHATDLEGANSATFDLPQIFDDFTTFFPDMLFSSLPPSSNELELLKQELQMLRGVTDDQRSRIENLEEMVKKQESYLFYLHDWATKTEKLNNEFKEILQKLHQQLHDQSHLQRIPYNGR